MARVEITLALVLTVLVAAAIGQNATTPAAAGATTPAAAGATTPAPSATTAAPGATTTATTPRPPNVLQDVYNFFSIIPNSLAQACSVGKQTVRDVFSGLWWPRINK